jgi:signal transduction histidine kinase
VPVFFIESHSIELMLPARELTGLIMAAYPIGEFIESTLKMLQPAGGLDIYVLETDEVGQENLLYFHPSRLRIGPYTPVPLGDMRRGWFEETQVRFGDRSWTLVFRPVEAAFAYREWPAAGAFSIGLVLTSLLTLYMFGAVTRRERIERLVGDRTNELSQVNAELNEKVGRLRTTEDALQKSQARFLQAMENDLDGVALFGANDRLIYCNERYRALCAPIADVIRPNVAFETMLTVAVQRGFIEEAIGCEAQWIQERMRRRHMPRGVMELRRSGRAVEIRENRAPDGSIFQVLSDVTEARLKEEHLNRAQKMEAVGAFAGGIAHDFNNILAVIRGYADLAKAFSRPDSPVAGHVTKIIRSVDRAAAVTKALLAFTRRRAPETRTVDLTRLLRDQKFLLKPLLKSKVELEISTDGPPLFARVDPDLFGQAIINLAINARDAMPAGGQLKLSIDCPPSAVALPPVVGSNGWARVMVADTGVGMDSETREQAFEPFFTTKGSGKGSGLGLAMVHRIVTQAGGSISVTSAPDCGTTFTIFLPTVEPPADVGAVEQMDDTMVPRTVRHTILLAEDEPELRTLLSDALSAAGHRVLTAQDGGTALEIFDEIAIDLLVTDILMPEVSGLELAALCKELRPALPVIYITGDPGPENDQGHDIPKGATVLFKPFAPARLMKAIDVALAAAKTTEESLV